MTGSAADRAGKSRCQGLGKDACLLVQKSLVFTFNYPVALGRNAFLFQIRPLDLGQQCLLVCQIRQTGGQRFQTLLPVLLLLPPAIQDSDLRGMHDRATGTAVVRG